MIEVTGTDRNLFLTLHPAPHDIRDDVNGGAYDGTDDMQAIAAHRQQAEDAMREQCAIVAENSAAICPPGQSRIAARIATAIRATPPKPDRLNGEGE